MAANPNSTVRGFYGAQHAALVLQLSEGSYAGLKAEADRLGADWARALARALNKVVRSARTRIVRRIAAEINVKQAEIRRKNVTIRTANPADLEARIDVRGRRIPLMKFAARQTRRGVSYAIKRRRRQIAPAAFQATMPSGHRGAFVRKGGGPGRVRRKRRDAFSGDETQRFGRKPIVELFGPSVPGAMENVEELKRTILTQALSEQLESEVANQVQLVATRRAKPDFVVHGG